MQWLDLIRGLDGDSDDPQLTNLHCSWLTRVLDVVPGLEPTLSNYCLLDLGTLCNLLSTVPSSPTRTTSAMTLIGSRCSADLVGRGCPVAPEVFRLVAPSLRLPEVSRVVGGLFSSATFRVALQFNLSMHQRKRFCFVPAFHNINTRSFVNFANRQRPRGFCLSFY